MDRQVESELKDHDSEDRVFAIVAAVAEKSGVDPLELPPLYEAVDPDRLDHIFATMDSDVEHSTLFTYAGYDVTITAAGDVAVSLIE